MLNVSLTKGLALYSNKHWALYLDVKPSRLPAMALEECPPSLPPPDPDGLQTHTN